MKAVLPNVTEQDKRRHTTGSTPPNITCYTTLLFYKRLNLMTFSVSKIRSPPTDFVDRD